MYAKWKTHIFHHIKLGACWNSHSTLLPAIVMGHWSCHHQRIVYSFFPLLFIWNLHTMLQTLQNFFQRIETMYIMNHSEYQENNHLYCIQCFCFNSCNEQVYVYFCWTILRQNDSKKFDYLVGGHKNRFAGSLHQSIQENIDVFCIYY